MSGANEPVAWAIKWASDREVDCEFVFPAAVTANDVQRENGGSVVVPLYRSPTLTDAEREAVADCYEWAMTADHRSLAATLRGLLERLK